MIVIPAIDLKGGKCVRLFQGKMEMETVYSDDPVGVAKRWEREGAKMLHIVDLDGAVSGSPVNTDAIKDIVKSLTIPCEMGGGVRSFEAIEKYLDMGLDRVVLGTAAVSDPALVKRAAAAFPANVSIGIDAVGGKVAIKGWTQTTDERATELARKLEGLGVVAINYTDISRDGALVGPNVEAIREMVNSVTIPIIAAGGVSKLDDLINISKTGAWGAITGKALYESKINLKRAIEMLADIGKEGKNEKVPDTGGVA